MPHADPRPWRRFFVTVLLTALGAGALLYGFIVTVDPWNSLPASPTIDRWPVDGNARYAFPALARDPRFDAAIFGTSTSRLLRPDVLNPLFDARFVNLAMNSATAFEQSSLLRVFLAAHPRPKVIAIGVDLEWCRTSTQMMLHAAPWPFPDWLYREGRWSDYLHMFTLYAAERAGQAFAEFAHLKPRVYGRDGYTRFVPDESKYDAARARANVANAAPWGPSAADGPDGATWRLPGMAMLADDLTSLPEATRKLLYLVPYNRHMIATVTGPSQELQQRCKREIIDVAAHVPGTTVIDFMRPSPITSDDDNYWDPFHYRVAIADRLARDLADGAAGKPSEDYAVLVGGKQVAPPSRQHQ